ncbi:chloramphenicol phosphotransferase [Streptomyces sp. LUP30]|uniref:phosphotransferase-like protein n=1 Tax=Streptomyces sp. LUP30 TaxID=1890285 RepID=UPI000851774C|nr:chloramphenicol phosphotransferase [Streptomyces sp. LUP30]
MTVQVIVPNGGSSSGKSGIDAGITFAADGGVSVGQEFRALDAAWAQGVAAMARAGAGIVVDDVFLGGAASQRRWREALDGLPVLWGGVRCEEAVAAGRETARGDRIPGTAAAQARTVHEGAVHDLEVDTARAEALACGRFIAARLGRPPVRP